MLSRVANSLYWMTRYIERAENIARLVDVNLQLLLDSAHSRRLEPRRPLDAHRPEHRRRERFFAQHPKATAQRVTEFLVFEPENPNSIVCAVSQARENARMVRDQITVELWEEFNRLYLFLRSQEARRRFARARRSSSARSRTPRCCSPGSATRR